VYGLTLLSGHGNAEYISTSFIASGPEGNIGVLQN
tara:strand:+ start:184 stop:288 length:105 start_codon:yes stop_codon:yes gene_type:complete